MTSQATSTSLTYAATLADAESIQWRVEDIIGGDKRLDFSKPFMPEALARSQQIYFLSPDEVRTLNQIRGLEYLYLFGMVEEFILPFVLDHARPQLHGDHYLVRSFMQFASEEAKHIHLFRRFRDEFEKGFGTPCRLIGPPEAIAQQVLAKDPLAVALAILHIEWMTQRHWIECVRDSDELDSQFKSLLRHHWMEEAQHAKFDTLMVGALAEGRTEWGIKNAVDDYLQIVYLLDQGLAQQAEFNTECFETASGHTLKPGARRMLMQVQHQAQRWTYLGSGMGHPSFLETLGQISPASRDRVEAIAPAFS